MLPRALLDERKIDSGIQRAAALLAPDVVRIRYNLGEDWTGDPSIFFRIVLTDHASREATLRSIVQRAKTTILHEVETDDMGLLPYFGFRSLSEQTEMKEESWA